MRQLEDARLRWEHTLHNNPDAADLKRAIKSSANDNPCINGLRSICWKIFLLFQELDTSTWEKTLTDTRSAYAALKHHYTDDLHSSEDLTAEDPLSENTKSRWTNLQQDEELRAEIFQDVERCMPEYSYFREPTTQNMLLEILFTYSKLNRDISYRQGMHEVLAPLLWVVYCDAIDAGEKSLDDDHHLISICLDSEYIEHDTFTLFGAVMNTVKTFYELGEAYNPVSGGSLKLESPIVERSKRIHENYLQHADPELAEHLTAIEVLPQIFLIRWIRLIFGREFPFEDVLALWDTLFAEDPALELIDLISVSMLLRIRWQLLEEDYTGALTLLLRYPAPVAPHGPSSFVTDAIYLRENLLLDGGDHIISKYSNKSPETTVTRKLPRRIKRAKTAEEEDSQETAGSLATTALTKHDRGIESIIQEAARGLYHTGEKWGVARAIKGAVKGLQATNMTTSNASRKPLDQPALLLKIKALEDRNAALSQMLAKSIDELWAEQKERSEIRPAQAGNSDTLSLAIAKVQFVQVYLENSSMQLPTISDENSDVGQQSTPKNPHKSENTPLLSPQQSDSVDGSVDEKLLLVRSKPKGRKSPSRIDESVANLKAPSTPTGPAHKIRPSLSESPYSWMLGDEQPKSEFVPSSPSRGGNKLRGEHSGALFGSAGSDTDREHADSDIFIARART